MSSAINILFATPEAAPLAQTGGLAEVAGSLPKVLPLLGSKSAVIMPAYKTALAETSVENMGVSFTIKQGKENISGSLLKAQLSPNVPIYLINCPEYYDRPGLYANSGVEYADNAERFSFFSKAVIEVLPYLTDYPDIIVGNDWQTGLIMPLLKEKEKAPKGVFAIHNQGFLGLVPPEKKHVLGLPEHYYSMEGMEYYGSMSLLKAGIVYSDAIVTVSPSYAKEIQAPEGGNGLDGVMRRHSQKLFGILNGVDYDVWNPATDPYIAAHYDSNDLKGKAWCKKGLLNELKMPELADKPVIGIVSRLAAQKGLNLVVEAADEIFKTGFGLVVLGSGESWQEKLMKEMTSRWPQRCSLTLGYDRALSHRIMAGCDFILLPSMYEPCGLAQMYALRYGTIPIVRAVGGLNDTVRDFAGQNPAGLWDTGFKFTQFQVAAMMRAIRRAYELYNDPAQFAAMALAGMREDFSWNNSARSYLKLFNEIMAKGEN